MSRFYVIAALFLAAMQPLGATASDNNGDRGGRGGTGQGGGERDRSAKASGDASLGGGAEGRGGNGRTSGAERN